MKDNKYYISNKDFLFQLEIYYKKGRIIPKGLHDIFYLLAERIIRKAFFYQKIFKQAIKTNDIEELYQDAIHEAYLKCCDKVESFDLINKKNPFAFFTSVVTNCYKDHFHMQYRQEVLKMIEQNDYEHKFLIKWGCRLNTFDQKDE